MAKWFTFPDWTDEECRQKGRRSDCLISSQGKVPQIHGKMVHFPEKNGENGGRINIFEGKVPPIRSKMVHFPGKNGENGDRINIPEGKVPQIRVNLVHFPR